MRPVVWFQIAMLVLCASLLMEFAVNFPYPSPFIKPLLPPRLRWPTDQVRAWAEADNAPADFRKFFARDPERIVPTGPNWVSPADGIVGPYLHEGGNTYLVINMSFWDVHVIRSPLDGVVTDLEEQGIRLERRTSSPEVRAENVYARGKDAPVQKIVTLKSVVGDVKVRMITSYWASRVQVWVRIGQKIAKGERIGRILFGSTTVFEVPGNIAFTAKPGTHVAGGESIVYETGKLQ